MIPNNKILTVLFLFVFFADCASTACAQNPKHELQLGRAIKAFDKYQVRGSAQRSSRVSMARPNGTMQIIPQGSSMVQVQANCVVDAVTVDGQEAKKSVVIRSAKLVKDAASEDLLPPDTKVNISYSDAGTVITSNGEPLADSISQELALVLRSEGGAKTGLIMNPAKPVSVGDTWKMNNAAFVKSLDADTKKNIKNVKGTVKFERIDTIRGTPAAIIVLEASATNVIPSNQQFRVSKSTFRSRIEVTVPLDVRYPEMHTHSESVWGATILPPDKNGSPVLMEFEHSDDISFYR